MQRLQRLVLGVGLYMRLACMPADLIIGPSLPLRPKRPSSTGFQQVPVFSDELLPCKKRDFFFTDKRAFLAGVKATAFLEAARINAALVLPGVWRWEVCSRAPLGAAGLHEGALAAVLFSLVHEGNTSFTKKTAMHCPGGKVTPPSSHWFGSSLATVRDVAASGRLCVMRLDVQGAQV
jgi:hypothetical protein